MRDREVTVVGTVDGLDSDQADDIADSLGSNWEIWQNHSTGDCHLVWNRTEKEASQ